MFKTEFVNLRSGEIFRLPTEYADRVEACVCGQNYCRDRQQEDGTVLFFRVVDPTEKNPYPQVHPICDCDEDDCDGECYRCGLCCEDEDEKDSEEPDFTEFEEIVNLLFSN